MYGIHGSGKKVSALKSIQTKIIGVVIFFVLVIVVVNLCVTIPMVSKNIEETLDNSMSTVTSMTASALNRLELQEGEEVAMIAGVADGVAVDGYKSSYVYVVRVSDSMMMYHPTADKIGQSVENEVVREVVRRLNAGEQVQQEVVKYEYRGSYKYAGYAPVLNNEYIVVVSVDYDDAFASLQEMQKNILFMSVVSMLTAAAVSFFIGRSISNPIKRLTAVIQKVGSLDFTSDPVVERLCRHGDEVGVMSQAIESMRRSMNTVLMSVENISGKMYVTSEALEKMAEKTNEDSSDNSATSEELAASMQETSATTEVIGENIIHINSTAGNITELSNQGRNMAEEIMKRAGHLKADAENTSKISQDVFAEVSKKTEEAIEKAKAVEKIQYLANVIMEIASQTSLLSLNASIEAARAGEAGRGFAVVAGEIGNLADQSAGTVKNITQIVEEVDAATKNMAECLKTMLEFMQTKVLKDYDQFIETSIQYNTDADSFKASMTEINSSITELEEALQTITVSIEGINTTIAEAAKGVTDIAQKTSDIVGATGQTLERANESAECAEELKEILGKFKL